MWALYAFFGAILASLGTIFTKVGLKGIDSNVLTTIRGIIMAFAVLVFTVLLGKFSGESFSAFTPKAWLYAVLSGLAGAGSWLFFFHALGMAPANAVTAIDKLSIVFTIFLAGLFLGESLSVQVVLGGFLMFVGAILITVPWSRIVESITNIFS